MNQIVHTTNTVRVHNAQVFVNDILYLEVDKPGDVINNDGFDFVTACYKHLNIQYPKFYKMDLMSKWGFICAELLLQQESYETIDPFKRAIVLQNSSSSILTDKNFQRSVEKVASPALFVYTLPNIVMGEIAIRHHFKGENTFFVTEKFDQVQITEYTHMLFDNNIAEIVINGYLEVTEQNQDISMNCCILK